MPCMTLRRLRAAYYALTPRERVGKSFDELYALTLNLDV